MPEIPELQGLVFQGWEEGVLCGSTSETRLLEVFWDARGRLNNTKTLGTASCLRPRAPHRRDQVGSSLGTPAPLR